MENIATLEKTIIDDYDKILFREATNCLVSKTYRAGYIVAWISIVESLKRKIFSLANTGDIQSKQSADKIETLEKNHKSADQQIVIEALNISLIEPEDKTKLDFFWNQRCLFAHPYEKEPTKDELIFIIQQAVFITLCKKLEFKKNYITELVDNLLNKRHFVSSDNNSIENYAKKTIPKIHKDLHSFFYKTLLAKIGEIKNDETKSIALKRLRLFSFELLEFTSEDISNDKWRMEDLALNFTYEFVLATCNSKVWLKIPSRPQTLVLEYIFQNEDSNEKQHITKILAKIYKKDLFSKTLESKFEEYLLEIPISDCYENYKNAELLHNRLVIEFDSGDFYRQQDTIRILKTDFGQEFQSNLSQNLSFELGRRITNAANGGCWEARDTLNYGLYRFTDNFKMGILIGAFTDREMSFRYEISTIARLTKTIDDLDEVLLNLGLDYVFENKHIDTNPHASQKFYLKSFKANLEHGEEKNNFSEKTNRFLNDIYQKFE